MGRSRFLPSAVVALVAIALYSRTVGFQFVFDDWHLVVNNAFLREAWSPLTAFTHHFWYGTPFGAAYYRPIVTSSLALNGRLLGWGPVGFHLINVLLHAANCALLCLLARRLDYPVPASFSGAALLALHPAASWAVASIVARVDLLPASFVLLGWLALRGAMEAKSGLRAWQTALTGLLFLGALLCKESAVAFAIVPLMGLRRMKDEEERVRLPWSVIAAVIGALTIYLGLRAAAGVGWLLGVGLIDPLINPLAFMPWRARFSAALELAGRYLLYLGVPRPFCDPRNYLEDAARTVPLPTAAAAVTLAVLAIWTGAILALWFRRDRISIPLAFALISFLPTSNIVFPIPSLYALNFLYLPLIGLALAQLPQLGLAGNYFGPMRG